MGKTALAIRHIGFENLGAFAPAISAAGYDIRYHDVGVDDRAGMETLDPDLLIVLGGPIGAHDDHNYPFLRDIIGFIASRLERDRPTMGICLGAQLIARAAGSRVYPGPAKEIGFSPITLTVAGQKSCLAVFQENPTTLHWHGDTFDLPQGAQLLAGSRQYENQAFSLGENTIAFQFHPEATSVGFEQWLIGHTAELSNAGINIPQLRADAAVLGESLRKKADAVCRSWLNQIRV
ncbi:glutamine amidotransferase [Thalassospira australica]|uniref:glutamine amidotransferase n=1 Tax=Thalassospira australica TaxID=1528106 RepID=UPI00051A3D3F|nr:glutamine amidotransferase [Thalassospira australica]